MSIREAPHAVTELPQAKRGTPQTNGARSNPSSPSHPIGSQDIALRNLETLRQINAIQEGHFRYESGRHGGLYVEKFRLLERPNYTSLLCETIVKFAQSLNPQPAVIAGPTTGGILISYETASQLGGGTKAVFAETEGAHPRQFLRGFGFARDEGVLIVDDVLTTGGSIRHTIEAVERSGGVPLGVAVLVDRTNGTTGFGDLPFHACLTLEIPSYDAADCPHCAEGEPLTIT